MNALLLLSFLFLSWSPATLREANEKQAQGLQAHMPAEQKEALNQALDHYLTIAQSTQPVFGNGKLYRVIGTLYEQLNEYPYALYYYSRAQTLMPRSIDVQKDLERVSKKLDLTIPPSSAFAPFFFFHTYLSLPERLTFFALCSLLLIGVLWLLLRHSSFILKISAYVLGVTLLLLLGSLLYSLYGEPVEGILVKATSLYKDASENNPPAVPVLNPGTRVHVLKQRDDGTWLQIETPDGSLGYIPHRALRILGP